MITNNRIDIGAQMAPDFLITLIKSEATASSSTTELQQNTVNISQRLISMSLEDNIGFASDSLTITLDDSDGQLQMPQRGEKIAVSIGWKGQWLTRKGSYIVDQITYTGATDKITVMARSVDFRGTFNSPRSDSYHATTLGDIAKTIAERNELSVAIDTSLSLKTIEHVDQSNESDVKFISRIARQYGATVTLKNDVLILFIAGYGKSISGKSLATGVIERRDGDGHSFSIADRKANPVVIAKWHDYSDAKTHFVKISTREVQTTDPTITHPKAQSTTTAQQTSGNSLSGDQQNTTTLSKSYANKDDATQSAVSQWAQLQRNGVQFTLKLAKGMEKLIPGMLVNIKGFKQIIDDRLWNIKKLTHTISSTGFVTEMELDVIMLDLEYDIEYGIENEKKL
ncbi:contractile injection system protein, VgrG/Pvc8 family [Pectobacteriaceae bacterium CE70]|nr:contractile injection system protein, VgrG/Pvc8 family [Pectobacteriaceae bacterium C52]WJV65192.1 contractile injection system protein, VgrG/Pvc8 family [Pectobacteriaceae bacterium CE70]